MKTIKYFLIIAISVFYTLNLTAQQSKVGTTEFKVSGVCVMCKERIESAALIKGVKLAEWDKETSMIKVIYSPKKTAPEKIQQAIAGAGHDTELVKATTETYKKLPKCCAYRDGAEKH